MSNRGVVFISKDLFEVIRLFEQGHDFDEIKRILNLSEKDVEDLVSSLIILRDRGFIEVVLYEHG